MDRVQSMVQEITNPVTTTTELEPAPTVPFGAKGRVIGKCNDPALPDADKRVLVRFDNGVEINMHIDDLSPTPPSQAKPSQE